MQNRYVADIGDFGKYGLLNFISKETNLKLGMNWYLFEPNDKEKKKQSVDGKFIDYLFFGTKHYKGKITKKYAQKIINTDEVLYKKLQRIIIDWLDTKGNRTVIRIEDNEILPKRTIYFKDLLNNTNRTIWLANSIKKLYECKIIFFDPDNGIDFNGEDKSPKHIYLDEIEAYYKNGKSLVIYQHANRNNIFNEVIDIKTKELINALNIKKTQINCLRYKRGTARAYFIIMQQEHYDSITKATNAFLEKWKEHFYMIEYRI